MSPKLPGPNLGAPFRGASWGASIWWCLLWETLCFAKGAVQWSAGRPKSSLWASGTGASLKGLCQGVHLSPYRGFLIKSEVVAETPQGAHHPLSSVGLVFVHLETQSWSSVTRLCWSSFLPGSYSIKGSPSLFVEEQRPCPETDSGHCFVGIGGSENPKLREISASSY